MSQDIVKAMQDLETNVSFGGGGDGGGGGNDSVGSYWGVGTGEMSGRSLTSCEKGVVAGTIGGAVAGSPGGPGVAGIGALGGAIAGSANCW